MKFHAEDEGTQTAALQALEEESVAKAKASKDTEGEVDTSHADERTQSLKRQKKQRGPKGRGADGIPTNIPRRGAV